MKKLAIAILAMTMTIALAAELVACDGSSSSRGPVYLKTKETCYNVSDGSISSQTTWARDNKGNATQRVTMIKMNGKEVTVTNNYNGFDQDGYPAARSTFNGEKTFDTTFEYTRESGKVVKTVESNGVEEAFSYHDNGLLKQRESKGTTGIVSTTEYDDKGFLIRSQSSDSTSEGNKTIMWTTDEKGVPTAATYNNTSSNKSKLPIAYTIQTDENGNVTRAYNAAGRLNLEFEYTKIDSPSLAAWIESHKISL